MAKSKKDVNKNTDENVLEEDQATEDEKGGSATYTPSDNVDEEKLGELEDFEDEEDAGPM